MLCVILDFFTQTKFLPPCTLPYALKKFAKISLKVTRFHGESVKNESAKTKKTRKGGGRQRPPPACLGLRTVYFDVPV